MSEPIRVLQVIGIMNLGGAETMIMNLYRHIDRTKVQFDFVQNENTGAFFDDEITQLGGKIYHCPRFTGKNYFTYRKWWRDFFDKHHEYAFVHGHIGSTAAIYLKEAKKHGVPTIAHSHNISPKSMKQFFYNMLSYPTRNIADYLFMCSLQAGIDRYGESAVSDKNRAYFVPNSIETERYRFDKQTREKVRRSLGFTEDALLIGHVGRFADQKNHLFLLDIFSEIVKRQPTARLLLVGDGTLRKEIEAKINVMDLSGKVILTGNRSDVNELLMAMDVFVFPSKYEGFGIGYVEAQCSGLPCIISDKVTPEGILIKEAVTVISLQSSTSEWANAILNCKTLKREECAALVKEAGFDVVRNAKRLEEFYLEKGK